MKKILLFIWETAKIAIIALVIVVPVRAFVFQPFFVKGASMEPNFHNFDYLIVDELSYRLSSPNRGDVIVFYNPQNTSQRFIKRVVGLPEETIKITDGSVFIKPSQAKDFFLLDESKYLSSSVRTTGAEEIKLSKGQYFVMGDNRSLSYDSRFFGYLDKKYIIGRMAFKVAPAKIFSKK